MTAYPLATETWDQAELDAIARVVDSRRFTMGPEVKTFEEQFAAYFGSRYAVMVNSGSSANLLMLAAACYHPQKFLKPGDAVLVPAVSWSTTYYPVTQQGLELRFVDINHKTLNLDLDLLEQALTPNTRAVLTVNLLGNPNDFARLQAFCTQHDLLLLEDNCESMGATFAGKQAGTFGFMGTYSTFFSHHISTMEGGVIVTDDEATYHTLLSLRAHGWLREQPAHSHLNIDVDDFSRMFRFVLPGYNVRPLEMEGAIGQAQLQKLPGLVAARRANAQIFQALFKDHPDVQIQTEIGESSWFGFALLLQGRLAGRRMDLVSAFRAAGIECRPIVTGNFLRNPVINLLKHTVATPMPVADTVDDNGLFLGNHHYPVQSQLEEARRIIDAVAATPDSCAA